MSRLREAYYAVARGRVPGIYRSWAECETQVKGFIGAKFKKFSSLEAARDFIRPAVEAKDTLLARTPPEMADCAESLVKLGDQRGPTSEGEELLIAFCDGACPKNGAATSAGWGVCWPFHPDWVGAGPLSGPVFTNIRAELTAVIAAIVLSNHHAPSTSPKRLVVYTDSKYCCDLVADWLPKWKAARWQRPGKPFANLDLVKALDILLMTRPVDLIFVPAHTNNDDFFSIWNFEADRLATIAARGLSLDFIEDN